MIGAKDMAYPRINALSLWLIPLAAFFMFSSFFVEGGAAQSGWTEYPPLSGATFTPGSGTDMWILGYGYSLSKRSSVFAYYTQVDNDTNSRASGIVFGGIGPSAGGDPKYYGVGLRHLF